MSVDSDKSIPEVLLNLRLALDGHFVWQQRRILSNPEQSLQRFLNHVACTVPFYRDSVNSLRLEFSLSDFPIVTRQLLGDLTSLFVSDVFREEATRFFAHSYGTTRKPLLVGFDHASWYDFNYATYDYLIRRLPGVKGHFAPGDLGVALVTNMPDKEPTAVILPNLTACLFRRLIVGRSRAEDLATVKHLRAHPPVLLYGKGSYLMTLLDLDQSCGGRTRIQPGALLASGECLYDDQRLALEEWFRSPLINAYVSTEGGVIAADCPLRTGMHIYQDRVLLEVEDGEGNVSVGGTGQLLLTNPSNWATTFVRYKIGDYGTISTGSCSCGFHGTTLTSFPGRDVWVYNISTGTLGSSAISEALKGLPLKNYQFIEMSQHSFRLLWVPQRLVADTDAVNALIRAALMPLLRDCTLEIDVVESVTPAGGKLRRFVSASTEA